MALEVEYLPMRHETRFERDGSLVKYTIVTFYIGKNGPFTEAFKADEFTAGAVQARVQQLKTHLELLQTK